MNNEFLFGLMRSLCRRWMILMPVAVFLLGLPAHGQNVITQRCVVGGAIDIGNAGDIFPPGPYTRMEVRATTVPGLNWGRMSRFDNGEEVVWGTVGVNTFAPATNNPFTQNRVYSGNGFRYTNTEPTIGLVDTIPVRFSSTEGFQQVDYTLRIEIISREGSPGIAVQPNPLQGVPIGLTATVSVVATGAPPLTYQWYHGRPPNTGSRVTNATSSTFTTPVDLPLGQHLYWVRISNPVSSVNSDNVTVNVGIPPVADAGGPYTVSELQTITLNPSVTDQDSTNHSFVWDLDNNNVFGQTGSQFGPENLKNAIVDASNLEGPGQFTVKVRVCDNMDLCSTNTTTVFIANAPPIATFTYNNGTVAFSGIIDSAGDLAAGMRFNYDFDGDGVFEITNTTAASVSIPAQYLAGYAQGVPVMGQVKDRDGGIGSYMVVSNSIGIVVSTLADEDDGTVAIAVGAGVSLREALNKSQQAGTNVVIAFAPQLFASGPVVSTLTLGQFGLTNPATSVSVVGPGASRLTLRKTHFQQMFFITAGTVKLSGLTIAEAQYHNNGGAIYNGGNLTMTDCVLRDNSTGIYGGAIYNGGVATISRCTFFGNRSNGGRGGAIANEELLWVFNSTFVSNLATNWDGTSRGGAIANIYSASRMRVVCSTLTGNSADLDAGALYAAVGTLMLNNSIVSGNSAPTNSNVAGTPIQLAPLSNLIDGDPAAIFASGLLTNNGGPTPTVALKYGGPAINTGSNVWAVDASFATPLPTDQRGIARIIDGVVDIGAFEYQAPPPNITSAATATFTVGASNSFTVVATSLPPVGIYVSGALPPGIIFSGGVFSGTPIFGAEGTYPVTITATNGIPPNATQNFVLTVASNSATPNSLANWRAAHGLPADGSQDFANPSGDGVANIAKYAFNLAPNPGALLVGNRVVLATNGTAGIPSVTVSSGPRLSLQFVRRKASTNPGLAYVVETSADVLNWNALELSNAVVQSIDATWERVTVTDTNSTSMRFGRVKLVRFDAYRNNFNSTLGAASLRGTAVWTNQAVQLTDVTNSQLGAVVFDSAYAGPALNGFTARFNMNLGPVGQAVPADGISFVVGDVGTGAWGESGPGSPRNLTISFDTYDNGGTGSIGIRVFSNNVAIASNPLNPFTGGATVPVDITYDAGVGVTVKFNGATIFNQVPTPGFVLPSGSKFGIGGRTGGAVERAVVDDLEIIPR